jgi:hypothetical protein
MSNGQIGGDRVFEKVVHIELKNELSVFFKREDQVVEKTNTIHSE